MTMRRNIPFLIIILVFISCQKDLHYPAMRNNETNPYLTRVKNQLEQQIPSSIRNEVNYSKAALTRINNDSILLLRIPFTNKKFNSDFVLIETDKPGNIIKGKIITIKRMLNSDQPYRFDGSIKIRSLKGDTEILSGITNGYIDAFNISSYQSRSKSLSIHIIPDEQPTYVTMPGIIIFGTSSGGSISYSDWYNLQMMVSGSINSFYSDLNSNPNAYYSMAGTANGGSFGGSSGSTTNYANGNNYGNNPYGVYTEDPRLVDFESNLLRVINLERYLKCFENIPDDGATCSIELFADVPVDSDPMVGFNTQTGSPGHTFLQLHKQNGQYSVTQNIGFYPASQLKTLLTTAPIEGVFADNQYHEFNASIKMSLAAEQFKSLISKTIDLGKRVKYDIDEYNCSDFALEVFNFARKGNELEIPRLDIPGAATSYGSNTPQGLYLKLKQMKNKDGPEASRITFPQVKGWVGSSKGSCN